MFNNFRRNLKKDIFKKYYLTLDLSRKLFQNKQNPLFYSGLIATLKEVRGPLELRLYSDSDVLATYRNLLVGMEDFPKLFKTDKELQEAIDFKQLKLVNVNIRFVYERVLFNMVVERGHLDSENVIDAIYKLANSCRNRW